MTKYPEEFDTNAEIPAVDDNITEIGRLSINGLREAVFALEKALGINPQGSANNLSSRLENALNDDGTIKAAALVAAGLVTLPIDNDEISSSAAIEESKLDLDYPTQTLKNEIDANNIDIAALQDEIATQISRITRHVLGIAERHSALDIDHILIDGYSLGEGSTVESALNYIQGRFLLHRSTTLTGEHHASAISYNPVNNGAVSATNVQDAISGIDSDFIEDRRIHNDSAHSDGISNDGYVYLNGQAGVNDASARLTRFQSFSAADLIKLGLVNAATIKSKNFSANDLNLTTADALNITATIGSGISRTLNITGLSSAVYPTAASNANLKGVVDLLNTEFADASNHFPVTAYESKDGELVLQHNIARNDCTLSVSGPAGTGAINELGFSEVENISVGRVDNYKLVVNGTIYNELKTLLSGTRTQASSSSIVDLGEDVEGNGVIDGYSLFHVYNHTTDSANGTYKIVSTATSPGTTITLQTSLPAGSFEYIIYADTFNTESVGSPRTFDFYLDDSRNPVVSTRQLTSSVQISGARIVEVSQNFPAATGASLILDDDGTGGIGRTLQLVIDGNSGKQVAFNSGFFGYLRVYAPDNISYITVLVHNTIGLGTFTDTINFFASEFQDNLLFLGTTFDNSGSILEIPLDRRNIGLVGHSAVGTEFTEDILSQDLANLHLSGIIRGFDVSSPGSTTIKILGGVAYVNGNRIENETQTITGTHVASSPGTYNLLMDKQGSYHIVDSTLVGYTLEDILTNDNFAILAQFIVSAGPVISSLTDIRFFINDVESRQQLTVDTRELGAGSFRTLEAAQLYATAAPNSTKQEITILTDLTISTAITITANTRLIAFGNFNISENLTLDTDAVVEVYGSFTAGDRVILNNGAKLILHDTADFTGGSGLELAINSTVLFEGAVDIDQIQILGDGVSLLGSPNKPVVKFSGSAIGIVASSRSNVYFSDLCFEMTPATNAILSLTSCEKVYLTRIELYQSSTTLANIAQTSRVGVNIITSANEIFIQECIFRELGVGLSADDFQNSYVANTIFKNVGKALELSATVTDAQFKDNIYDSVHTTAISFEGSNGQANGILISDSFFHDGYDGSSSPEPIDSSADVDNIIITTNRFYDISASFIIEMQGYGTVITNNTIDNCTTTSPAINLPLAGFAGVISDNIITNHTGPLIRTTSSTITGNRFEGSDGGFVDMVFINANSQECPFNDNIIILGDVDDTVVLNGAIADGNFIEAGSITLEGANTAPGVSFNGNIFIGTNVNATETILIDINGGDRVSFTNNFVYGTANTSCVKLVGDSVINMTGNTILPISGGAPPRALTVGDGGTASTNQYLIANNHITNGGSYGIYIDASNVTVEGNHLQGSTSTDEIVVTSGKSNIMIFGNTVNAAGAAGTGNGSVRHQDSSPTNTFIRYNKNATGTFTYSSMNALQVGDWTTSLSLPNTKLISTSGTNRLIVPLPTLPTGAKLETVTLYTTTAGSAGDVNIRLVKRSTGSGNSIDIGSSSGVSSTAITFQTLDISPTLTEYIGANDIYLLIISSTTASNEIGQIVATVRF